MLHNINLLCITCDMLMQVSVPNELHTGIYAMKLCPWAERMAMSRGDTQ